MRLRLVGMCAAAVCLAVALPSAGGARPRAAAASTPRCLVRNLRVDRIGHVGFTSHRSWDMALRNVGSGACSLKGYPDARLLNGSAQPEPTNVQHVGGPSHTVLLQPFHRGFFSFTYAVSGPCPAAVFATAVRFTPPRASRTLVWYQGSFDLCGPGPATVSVSPVMKTKPF